jgi:NhaP-type Na+/H+ or K+/H+ antiporter
MSELSGWEIFAVFGLAGFGIGLGLVLGAFVARTLRRYMTDEDMKPDDQRRRNGRNHDER